MLRNCSRHPTPHIRTSYGRKPICVRRYAVIHRHNATKGDLAPLHNPPITPIQGKHKKSRYVDGQRKAPAVPAFASAKLKVRNLMDQSHAAELTNHMKTLGVVVNDPKLIQRSLTDWSVRNDRNNKSLIYIGISFLSYLVTEEFVKHRPDIVGKYPRHLHKLVKQYLDTRSVYLELAEKMKLPQLMRVDIKYYMKREVNTHHELPEGEVDPNAYFVDAYLPDDTGYTLIANGVKAFVGGMYMDQGEEAARALILRYLELDKLNALVDTFVKQDQATKHTKHAKQEKQAKHVSIPQNNPTL